MGTPSGWMTSHAEPRQAQLAAAVAPTATAATRRASRSLRLYTARGSWRFGSGKATFSVSPGSTLSSPSPPARPCFVAVLPDDRVDRLCRVFSVADAHGAPRRQPGRRSSLPVVSVFWFRSSSCACVSRSPTVTSLRRLSCSCWMSMAVRLTSCCARKRLVCAVSRSP